MHQGHVAALETKHAQLDARLHEELTRPAPDDFLIKTLKRRKLSLKDVRQREIAD